MRRSACDRRTVLCMRKDPAMNWRPLDTVIIASGDDEVSIPDVLEWIAPLLAGIPRGAWSACTLDVGREGNVEATFLAPLAHDNKKSLRRSWNDSEMQAFARIVPTLGRMAVVMLNECASQAFCLIDVLASWLTLCDSGQEELEPLINIFAEYDRLTSD
jgi:hypothetical protein